MRHIEAYIVQMDEELEGAKKYAEKSVCNKADGNAERAKSYWSMAGDELKHATALRDMGTVDIKKIEAVAPVPTEMKERWERACEHYVEETAWVKKILEM